jgi:uncharacterized protein YgiM (DUF1202 family)
MSHNKHTNYSKISTTPAVVDVTNEDDVIATVVESTPEVETTPEPPVEPIEGFVSGCKKLNIREEATLEGKILCEVSEGTTLMIDENESTDAWYRVYTETGVEGYCMKIFVTIES